MVLAHLLKYDTAQGSYVAQGHAVTYKDSVLGEDGKTVVVPGSITVDGKETTYKVGDNVPACIDYVDYDDYLEKIKKEIRNKCREAEEQYDKYSKKLQAKYNQYWDRSWWY